MMMSEVVTPLLLTTREKSCSPSLTVNTVSVKLTSSSERLRERRVEEGSVAMPPFPAPALTLIVHNLHFAGVDHTPCCLISQLQCKLLQPLTNEVIKDVERNTSFSVAVIKFQRCVDLGIIHTLCRERQTVATDSRFKVHSPRPSTTSVADFNPFTVQYFNIFLTHKKKKNLSITYGTCIYHNLALYSML